MLAGGETAPEYAVKKGVSEGEDGFRVTAVEPIVQVPTDSDPGLSRPVKMECLAEEIRSSLEYIKDSVYKLREEISELRQLEETLQIWKSRDLVVKSDNLAEIVQHRVHRLKLYERECKKRVTLFWKVLLVTDREFTPLESDDAVLWYQCLLRDSISDYQLLCSIETFLKTYETMNVDLGDAINTLQRQKASIVDMLQAVRGELKMLHFPVLEKPLPLTVRDIPKSFLESDG
jgi:prefoldin subunit 5